MICNFHRGPQMNCFSFYNTFFVISRTTLCRRKENGNQSNPVGRPRALENEEEKKLESFIIARNVAGMPLTVDELAREIKRYD